MDILKHFSYKCNLCNGIVIGKREHVIIDKKKYYYKCSQCSAKNKININNLIEYNSIHKHVEELELSI